MEDDDNISQSLLEKCSYRYLQQIAKTMNLPCNVKKMYLIQLIIAKKYGTVTEVDNIVKNVKLERLQKAKKRVNRHQMHLQGTEISSTSNPYKSPPVTVTPKRSLRVVLRCSPDKILKYTTENQLRKTIPTQRTYPSPKINRSDRVLRNRTLNIRALTRPGYGIMNFNNTVFGVIKTENKVKKETQINIQKQEQSYQKLNITTKCIIKNHKSGPGLSASTSMICLNEKDTQRQLKSIIKQHKPGVLPVGTSIMCLNEKKRQEQLESVGVDQEHKQNMDNSPHIPARRQRLLSGIYPLTNQENTTRNNMDLIQNISYQMDNRYTKINTVVQKCHSYVAARNSITEPTQDYNNDIHIHLQDSLNHRINVRSNSIIRSNLIYTQAYQKSDVLPNMYGQQNRNLYNPYAGYLINIDRHSINNKIYGQVSSNRELPQISEAFSRFNNVQSNYTQPLYVQVSLESERCTSLPMYITGNTCNTHMLENIYNLKSQFLTYEPLLQMVTICNTKSVFSTSVITTAVAHNTTTVMSDEQYNVCSSVRDNQYQANFGTQISRNYEAPGLLEQEFPLRHAVGYTEERNESTLSHSVTQCPQADPDISIPDMVEDALEIISQDGDYVERIGLDSKKQCVLCLWAGPEIILEYHIRKEHSIQIHRQDRTEWNMTYTLGNLVQKQVWSCEVYDYESMLYVLSVIYEDPDHFKATLSTLSPDENFPKIGSITIYNKVTGEPHTWQGEIQELPSNLPFKNDTNCLQLQLSKLDLIPNSANLQLLNRSLVIKSPSKVVIGQPELDDIHINVFVKILN